jgi:hypothetical protein
VLGELLVGVPSDPVGDDLDEFLQFTSDGTDTDLAIDADGSADFATPDVTVMFNGVDLVSGAPSQAAAIDGLLASGQLEVG